MREGACRCPWPPWQSVPREPWRLRWVLVERCANSTTLPAKIGQLAGAGCPGGHCRVRALALASRGAEEAMDVVLSAHRLAVVPVEPDLRLVDPRRAIGVAPLTGRAVHALCRPRTGRHQRPPQNARWRPPTVATPPCSAGRARAPDKLGASPARLPSAGLPEPATEQAALGAWVQADRRARIGTIERSFGRCLGASSKRTRGHRLLTPRRREQWIPPRARSPGCVRTGDPDPTPRLPPRSGHPQPLVLDAHPTLQRRLAVEEVTREDSAGWSRQALKPDDRSACPQPSERISGIGLPAEPPPPEPGERI